MNTDHPDSRKELCLEYVLGHFEKRGIAGFFFLPECYCRLGEKQRKALFKDNRKILRDLAIDKDDKSHVVVKPYASKGDLFDYVYDIEDSVPVGNMRAIVVGILMSLHAIKLLGYIHGDVKANNLLVDDNAKVPDGSRFITHVYRLSRDSEEDNEDGMGGAQVKTFVVRDADVRLIANDFDCCTDTSMYPDKAPEFQHTTREYSAPDCLWYGVKTDCLGQDQFAAGLTVVYVLVGKELCSWHKDFVCPKNLRLLLNGYLKKADKETDEDEEDLSDFYGVRSFVKKVTEDGRSTYPMMHTAYQVAVLLGLPALENDGRLAESPTWTIFYDFCERSIEFKVLHEEFGIDTGTNELVVKLRENLSKIGDVKEGIKMLKGLLNLDKDKRFQVTDPFWKTRFFESLEERNIDVDERLDVEYQLWLTRDEEDSDDEDADSE